MSDKYTYADIIIDPSDPRLEGAIGKECYCNDLPYLVLKNANEDIDCCRLKHIWTMDLEDPFTTDLHEDICSYSCPCIILKKEEAPKYKPFDLSKKEVRDKLRGQSIVKKESSSEFMITGFGYEFEPVVYIHDTYLSAKLLLEQYTFLDGTPCGELVEDEA